MGFFPSPTFLPEPNFVFAIFCLQKKYDAYQSNAFFSFSFELPETFGHTLTSCCLYQLGFAQGSRTQVSEKE